MARLMSRRARRTMRNFNSGAQDVKGFIDENPVTAAVIALAAGVAATSAFKMVTGKPAAPAAKVKAAAPKKAAPKTRRKAAAKGK